MTSGKSELRALMRRRRRALSRGESARLSALLRTRLFHHPFYNSANTVGLYYPNDGEIDIMPGNRERRGKRFFLPVLPPPGKRRLWFSPYRPGEKLVADRYGIPEPVSKRRVRIEELDLVVVPLVAFDECGGRLGMGGGFYDSSLSFLSEKRRTRPLRVIGAAFEFQRVDSIPRERWDIPLHGVITERNYLSATSFRSS